MREGVEERGGERAGWGVVRGDGVGGGGERGGRK